MLIRRRRRRGATAVENAFVLPVMFILILGIMVLGLGIFHYSQMSYLAREGARWASVHGAQYANETGNAAATAADVYTNAIQPKMTTLDSSKFSYAVTWNTNNNPYHTVIDGNNNLVKVGNTVTVMVSYSWVPEAYFIPVTLTSTSVMPMSY